jgi:hypothetical protein
MRGPIARSLIHHRQECPCTPSRTRREFRARPLRHSTNHENRGRLVRCVACLTVLPRTNREAHRHQKAVPSKTNFISAPGSGAPKGRVDDEREKPERGGSAAIPNLSPTRRRPRPPFGRSRLRALKLRMSDGTVFDESVSNLYKICDRRQTDEVYAARQNRRSNQPPPGPTRQPNGYESKQELSRSTWLITSLSPGGGEKMS